jgi:hypothetical protein
MTRREKIKFIVKVTLIHALTYIVCGVLFSMIFSYQDTLSESTTMRSMTDPLVMAAPLFQIVRGVLFGFVLLWMREIFVNRKFGWLKLWLILLVLGVFNTPAPSPGSIEGFIYLLPTDEPFLHSIGGILEIATQTLLFSVLVTAKTILRKKSEKSDSGKGQ